MLNPFCYFKRFGKKIFYLYFLSLFLIAILPLNSTNYVINHVYVVSLRLDHLLHGLLFLPWVFIFYNYYKPTKAKALILGLAAALILECIQYFTTYRSFNINDLIANFVGASIGGFTLLFNDKLICEEIPDQK